MSVDVEANRRSAKWGTREKVGRVLWACFAPAFRLSPRPLWGWRRFLLRSFGATIGRDVHVYPSVRITIPWNVHIGDFTAVGDRVQLYALGPIAIGRRSTISQGAHLCAGSHDYRLTDLPLLKPPIAVGDDVWICADAFIGPGVRVSDRAIVAARSVVVRDVASGTIVGGHPAAWIKDRPVPG